MELQIGKQYYTRNGLKTEPLRESNNGTNYKFEAVMYEPQHKTPSIRDWLPNGRYLTGEIQHGFDLVCEVE